MENINSKLSKRECELKFEIQDDNKMEEIMKKINELGFRFISKNLETDFTPDVEGFICKKNGLILRFRAIDGISHRILITLKVKQDNAEILDNYEIEFYFDEFDEDKYNLINDILYKYTKIKLKRDIFEQTDIIKICELLLENGLKKQRTFIQKKRSEYMLDNIKITIDELPKNIGTYLEIETDNNNDLEKIIKLLQFDSKEAINKKYGKIIKESQADLPEEKRGICFFDKL